VRASASTRLRRHWWNPVRKNYLTMALEEVAEGKLKYKYPK